MEYERKYQNRINWQNTPSMNTPLNATNLNKMDVALQYMDGKLAEASGDIVSIEANPSGTATSNLTKLKVDSTIYNVGSYTAGTGINIVNGAIQNTETGARSGIIDSISSSRAHTQIMLATNETFKPYETLILKSETSGTASTLRVQYASSASSVYDYNLYDTDGTTAKTLSLESGQIIIVMLDQTGYKAIVLSDGISGGADALSDLTDTSISNPTNGQTIEYNSTSGKWENKISTAVVANPSDTTSTDLTKIKIGSTAYNIPKGSIVSKTTYLVDYSSWSSTTNSDGFYTSTFTVSPSLDTSVPPNIYISGGGGYFQPNNGELNRYKNIKRARLNSNMLMTLYATSKPGGNFTIYVEGVLGSGSNDTMVNVIQPNGDVSGLVYSATEHKVGTWFGTDLYAKTFESEQIALATDKLYTYVYNMNIPTDNIMFVETGVLKYTHSSGQRKMTSFPCRYDTDDTAGTMLYVYIAPYMTTNNAHWAIGKTMKVTVYYTKS